MNFWRGDTSTCPATIPYPPGWVSDDTTQPLKGFSPWRKRFPLGENKTFLLLENKKNTQGRPCTAVIFLFFFLLAFFSPFSFSFPLLTLLFPFWLFFSPFSSSFPPLALLFLSLFFSPSPSSPPSPS